MARKQKIAFRSSVGLRGLPIRDATGREIGTITEVHEKEGDEGIVEVVGVIEDEQVAQSLVSGFPSTFSMGAQIAKNFATPIKAISMGCAVPEENDE